MEILAENNKKINDDQRNSINQSSLRQSHIEKSHSTRRSSKSDEVVKLKHDEYQYLNLISRVIFEGDLRNDRNGSGTWSIFGSQARYNLKDDIFPILTTKRVSFKAVLEELLWFIQGSTNAKILTEKGVKLWEANASRQFLDGIGLTLQEEGDLGPIYGFQWRHFGATYTDMHANYSGQGVDQLTDLIKRIKERPNDKRLLILSWNPADLPKMAVPPLHCLVQFYVANGYLSSQLYQRSTDMILGLPFSIASYSLLTYLIAHVTGLKPKEFIHTLGEAHVDHNHVEALREQMSRKPKPFPKLLIKRQVENIEDFRADDFELVNYDPHPSIRTSFIF